MNLRHKTLLLAIFLGGAVSSWAQIPSTTGTVTALSRENGQVAVLPEGRSRPVYFRDMKRARFVYANGQRAAFDHLAESQIVTVQYTRRGDRWYVGQVILPAPSGGRAYPGMPPEGLTPAQRRATTSRTLTDRDITTQPTGNAGFDRDITTQPGRTNPSTNTDITKRPDNR